MEIIKDNKDYYLCDDYNMLYLSLYSEYHIKKVRQGPDRVRINLSSFYDMLIGYELGSFEELIEINKYFVYDIEWKENKLAPTVFFIENHTAIIRDIKINNILN